MTFCSAPLGKTSGAVTTVFPVQNWTPVFADEEGLSPKTQRNERQEAKGVHTKAKHEKPPTSLVEPKPSKQAGKKHENQNATLFP